MVSIPEAIIHEDAMVIEFLYTSVAKVAVVSLFGSQSFAGNTNVVQMIVLFNQAVNKLIEILLFLHIARVDHHQRIEQNSAYEKYR